ncbi:hypothetical protein [Nocardioides sp. SR21]|uniref:hypothetical protein n=1 Tax=Nocardioides sp. SR21 TaxID=2919501 RepID=UPI001FA98AFC|nr:hypothetical protein [Nocardioides sp. SR21]
MRLIAAPLAAVVATGFGVLLAAPASAHTPDISASCAGVHVGATAYDADQANRWSVTINGVTQTGTFGASVDQTFPVPQDGATSTWSAFVEAADGSYHGGESGEVGPCGAPPADACTDLTGTQPAGTPCTPPPDVTRSGAGQLADCEVTLAGTTYDAGELTYDEEYTDTYVFNETTNAWDLVTDTEPTISDVVFTPWDVAQQVQRDCVERAPQPEALQASQQSIHLDCADNVEVTTTVASTTPYVYVASENTWVPGHATEHTSHEEQPAQPGACDRGVSASHVGASSQAGSALVPTSVDAGSTGAAALAPVAGSTKPVRDSRDPALLLLAAGGALVAAGALRVRRS